MPAFPPQGAGFETDTRRTATITELPKSVVSVSSLQPSLLSQVEQRSPGYTVYLDQVLGNDANLGNSEGQAVRTLAKAIALLQVAGHGGEIHVVTGAAAGNIDVSAPLSIVYPIKIRSLTPSSSTIRRTFGTPNGRSVWDAVTTAAGTSVSSATATFTSGDTNRIVVIYGAGTGGGTYYDFGTFSSSTILNLQNASGTAVARNSTTDPYGVKLSIVGDWNRVITDASMAQGGSVVTSATAAWTTADIGTEVVIAGAGQGGQALRGAIQAISGNTATLANGAACSKVGGVSGARCAIGVNFGDLFAYHAGQAGLEKFILADQTSGNNSIGSAIFIATEDGGSGSQFTPSDIAFEHVTITSTDTAGAWEHVVTCDGSWNQASGGPGCRRVTWVGCKFFGARRAGETLRLINPVHWTFAGIPGFVEAPTSIAAGVMILDPQNTAGVRVASEDVMFAGAEGEYFYSEGSRTHFFGNQSIAQSISGRPAVALGPTSKNCNVIGSLATALTGANASDYDAGTNNRIELNTAKRLVSRGLDNYVPATWIAETFSRNDWGAANASQVQGSSGVQLLSLIWLPGGTLISKIGLTTGGTALAWGSGYTGPHFQVGLIGPDGNIVAVSADTGGTQVLAASTITSISMATPARTPYSGLCAISILINSGTGGTSFAYPSWGGFSGNFSNFGTFLTATNGSGLTAVTATAVPPVSGGVQSRLYQLVG